MPNPYQVNQTISLAHLKTKEVIPNAKDKLKKVRKKLAKIQDTMYAHNKYSVLICLQGMDTGGKDSLIREVFKNFNTRGINVHSFKQPTSQEKEHDFIWRHYLALPERGKFAVFNRTHYENVLVTRVHPAYILSENIPGIDDVSQIDETFYHQRMEHINQFEKHWSDNGMIILKFYLHLSKKEQKNRLLRRIELQEKNWKFSSGDLEERQLWNKYMFCYEDMLNRTSKKDAPWFVIPADDKDSCRLIVAETILETLERYTDIQEPELDEKTLSQLEEYKQLLRSEDEHKL
ncbi:PPK2 family polyphosphate kinase [Namhaeicola litoreus]|uniref:PPK2 family polyphosphate kinase n=1 Tax=Namhaeicola litoreus TaxID=1052145 RepID=A0ABW3Y2I2_9FLAO